MSLGSAAPADTNAFLPNLGNFVPLSKDATPATSALSSNLTAALNGQSEKLKEVEVFLSAASLERYFKMFEEHGFDCMETVKCMTEEHLKGMGIPVGHCLKLQKRIQELNAAELEPLSPPRQSNQRKSKVHFPEESAVSGATGSLLDGTFDEAESANSFKDAVAAWRDGGKTAPATTQKKAFSWGTLGSSDVELPGAKTAPAASCGTDTTPKSGVPQRAAQIEERHCCYVCYKQFVHAGLREHDPILKGEKVLCGEPCKEAFLKEIKEKQAKYEEREMLQRKLLEAEAAEAAEARVPAEDQEKGPEAEEPAEDEE